MITTSKRVLACVTAFLVACSLCLVMDSSAAQAKSARYWLKVNKKTCVVTAYKMTKKKWKPVRAMRCSVGRFFTPTPSGNFHVSSKWRWLNMKGCWGQYVSQFYGDYLCIQHSRCCCSRYIRISCSWHAPTYAENSEWRSEGSLRKWRIYQKGTHSL